MDDKAFMQHANSINAIVGCFNPVLHEIRSGGVTHALIRCINHLYAQNMMLYNELMRRENEELMNTNCIVEENENGNR